jgi:quercetin dioxygenase-like cupin family protein
VARGGEGGIALMGARVVHLDEIERVAGPETLTWLPVRATLGIRAFGCNAYVAGTAGEDVVEPHTEDPAAGHEELYFVARGRAEFTVDGERIDAPAGTYVFVPEPSSHRHAVAVEEGTTVLSFGGPPAFEPSAWEWHFRAEPLFDSDPERAQELLDEGLAANPDSASIRYHRARLAARRGDTDTALAELREAIAREPKLEADAAVDDDLRGLPRK